MRKAYQFLVLVSFVAGTLGKPKHHVRKVGDFHLYGDVLLTPEQEMQMKEKSILDDFKWPIVEQGRYKLYYFFDGSISTEDIRRDLVRQAAGIYTEETCLDWIEVSEEDPRAQVKILYHDGCFANIGYVKGGKNYLSLGEGCDTLTTTLHEMGHTMSMLHTQVRSDRDSYVEIWEQNIDPVTMFNFDIQEKDNNYSVPYDYGSVMHYEGMSFSTNSKFTITTKNPYAQFIIGENIEKLAWSDKALLNRAYQCENLYAKSCGYKKACQNAGYMDQSCVCQCPENTRGELCERVTSNFFVGEPECGGNITKEVTIQSVGFGVSSTTDTCTFWIQAPKCKKVSIKLTDVNLYDTHCKYNLLAFRIYKNYFEDIFCRQEEVWPGLVFTSDTNEAFVYFYQSYEGQPDIGFKADVTFIDDSNCRG